MLSYNKYSQSVESRGVKLLELLIELLRKWKTILLVSIFVALVFVVASSAVPVANKDNMNITIEDLNKEDIEYLNKIEVLETQLTDLREYRDNSVKMKTNARERYLVTLEYKLQSETDLESLCLMYRNYIIGGGLVSDIKEEIDETERDIYDNISIRDRRFTGEEMLSSVLIVQISHYDKTKCEKIAEIVNRSILDYNIEVMNPYNIVKTAEYSGINVDVDIQTQQDNVLRSITEKETAIEDIKTKLSIKAIEYLNNPNIDDVQPEQIANRMISVKSIFLGSLIGIIFSCVFIVVFYMFDNTIKSVDEIGGIYKIRVYGILKKDNFKKKSLKQQTQKRFFAKERYHMTADQEKDILCTKIILACKKENITQIFLSFASETYLEREDMKDIIKNLQKSGINVQCGIGLIYNADVLEKANLIKNVILTETLRFTLYHEMANELQICEEYGINVMGAIVFDK